jgi:hypothetical protein
MRHLLLAPPLLVLLAACEVPVTPPAADACGAAGAQAVRGGARLGPLRHDLHPARALHPPGDVVTMDFREDRLNFDIDAGEVVTRAYCG